MIAMMMLLTLMLGQDKPKPAPAPACGELLATKGLMETLALVKEFLPLPLPVPTPMPVPATVAALNAPPPPPPPAPVSMGDSLRLEAARIDRRDIVMQRIQDTLVTCQAKEKK